MAMLVLTLVVDGELQMPGLHWAALEGDTAMVDELVHSVCVDVAQDESTVGRTGPSGRTALMIAVFPVIHVYGNNFTHVARKRNFVVRHFFEQA